MTAVDPNMNEMYRKHMAPPAVSQDFTTVATGEHDFTRIDLYPGSATRQPTPGTAGQTGVTPVGQNTRSPA